MKKKKYAGLFCPTGFLFIGDKDLQCMFAENFSQRAT